MTRCIHVSIGLESDGHLEFPGFKIRRHLTEASKVRGFSRFTTGLILHGIFSELPVVKRPTSSVAHETRILAESLDLARIVRSRNVSPVSCQSRQFSMGLVVLASSRLSRQRSGCYGAAGVVSGGAGIARDLKALQGTAQGC
jgi:hypothetical protein